jgi:hypothetical protein
MSKIENLKPQVKEAWFETTLVKIGELFESTAADVRFRQIKESTIDVKNFLIFNKMFIQ